MQVEGGLPRGRGTDAGLGGGGRVASAEKQRATWREWVGDAPSPGGEGKKMLPSLLHLFSSLGNSLFISA